MTMKRLLDPLLQVVAVAVAVSVAVSVSVPACLGALRLYRQCVGQLLPRSPHKKEDEPNEHELKKQGCRDLPT